MIKLITPLIALSLFAAPLASAAEKVISIGGSLTEVIYAVGAGSSLVASDTTSYFPVDAAMLPKVGYLRALSTEGILSLKPDLIIASEEAGPPNVIRQIKATGVPFEIFKTPKDINGIKEGITRVGALYSASEQAAKLNSEIDQTIIKLEAAKKAKPVDLKVLFVMFHGAKTPMAAGLDTSANAIIKLAGAQNVNQGFEGYKPLTPEAAAQFAPDVILTTTQSMQQIGGMDKFMSLPGMAYTPARKNGHIIAMDALLLLGFGPRTADAALELHGKLSGS